MHNAIAVLQAYIDPENQPTQIDSQEAMKALQATRDVITVFEDILEDIAAIANVPSATRMRALYTLRQTNKALSLE